MLPVGISAQSMGRVWFDMIWLVNSAISELPRSVKILIAT